MPDDIELDISNMPEWLKSPEQIAREIAVPGTLANKVFNEMVLHAVDEIITYQAFVIYAIQHAAQIERLAMQEERDQQSIEARQQERISAVSHEVHERYDNVEGKDIYQLEARAAELQKDIFEIDIKIEKCQKQIEEQTDKLKTLHDSWVSDRKVQSDAFLDELKAKLKERSAHGTPVLELRNEKNQKIEIENVSEKIRQAVQSIKSPTEILKVNPLIKRVEKIMICNDLVCELRTRACMIEDEVNSKNLLCVIRNNKKMPVYRHTETEKKIAADAIDAMQKKKKAGDEQDMLRVVKLAKEKEFGRTVDELRSHNQRHLVQPKQSGSDS